MVQSLRGLSMICYRCQQRIHSGKIEKIIEKGVTTSYCKHCYAAVRYG